MTKERKKVYGVIPKEGLEALARYQYHGIDLSIVANHVGQPFWRWAVNLLPYWMAPNLVTLIGLGFIFLSYSCLTWYSSTLDGAAPSWVYYLAALCLFLYQTLDALDGKQARRTGTSSPLGELFDHGCDAVTGTLFALNLSTSMQIGSDHPVIAYLGIITVIIPFYFAQWEEYHTGTLVLGYINVTEAQLAGIAVYLISATFGPDFWLQTLSWPTWHLHVRYSTIVVLLALLGGLVNVLTAIINVSKFFLFGHILPTPPDSSTPNLAQQVSSANKSSSSSSPTSPSPSPSPNKLSSPSSPLSFSARLQPLFQLVGVLSLSIFGWLWASSSPNNIHKSDPHLLILTVGFLNSSLVGRLIVARVCGKLPVSPFQLVLFPFYLATLLVVCFPNIIMPYEHLLAIFCTAHAIFAYLFFAYRVTSDLCSYLNINPLSMTPQQLQKAYQNVHQTK